jgi:tetratricopeptide (TPR) repeat protein
MELDPGLEWVHAQLSWAYGCKGDYPQAITENEKAGTEVHRISAENQLNAAGLGWIYALAGRRGDAQKVISQFKELEAPADVDHYNVAVVYAGLGEKDRTFEALERAYAQRSGSLAFLNADPFFKDMSSDPRYQDLLRRIGLSLQKLPLPAGLERRADSTRWRASDGGTPPSCSCGVIHRAGEGLKHF